MIVLLVASCDLLKTRDSETPVGGIPANPPAYLPKTLIENLQSSFANKNANEYEKLFSDTISGGKQYIFIPTQKAAGSYAAFASSTTPWTKESEITYFKNAMEKVGVAFTPIVSFSDVVETQIQADSALYAADYSVFLPTKYVGHARFFMLQKKNAGTWVIYRWEDFPSAKDSTLSWSDLKGQNSQ